MHANRKLLSDDDSCSVACNHIHKKNHPLPQSEAPPSEANNPLPQAPADARDNNPYSVLLEHRADFARLFQKYPSLESELFRIQQSTLPPDSPAAAVLSRQPLGGAGGRKQPVWSRDVGLRQGAAALRKARTDPGDRGDGVREFCDLVLYLLGRTKEQVPGGVAAARDAASLVREEVVAEETKIIERLLREEGGDMFK